MRHLAEKSILIFCILFSFLSISFCSDISISANVDKNSLSLDGQPILEVNVLGKVSSIPNPTLPYLPNFNAYFSGRSQTDTRNGPGNENSVGFYVPEGKKFYEAI
ncbi:MAG: hypothetical protein NT145_04955 [Elusimicrobia bacterium]|nr:hypothetical protein [Elusimicrobiota bacterium]